MALANFNEEKKRKIFGNKRGLRSANSQREIYLNSQSFKIMELNENKSDNAGVTVFRQFS